MRGALVSLIMTSALSIASIAPGAGAAPSHSDTYHIVLPRHALATGERVELRLEPPAPAGLTVHYCVSVGSGGIGMNPFRAPYVIAPGTPPARVSASFSGQNVRASVSTEIELVPGSMPGTEDCLGPGQSFSTVYGNIEPEYIQLDVLPQLVHSVEPEYPPSALARGIEDTIACHALVCRSGRVLDAVPLLRYRDRTRVESDPKLIDAALAAVKQYVFSPGMVSGLPVAVWVATQVIFHR